MVRGKAILRAKSIGDVYIFLLFTDYNGNKLPMVLPIQEKVKIEGYNRDRQREIDR